MPKREDTPKVIGPYRVGAPIGMGAAANVVEAVHEKTGEHVALKILSADWIGRAEMVSRFLREGRALQRLRHPNIVRVIEHGVSAEGAPWIAMERVRAVTLDALIQERGKLEPERALRLAIDVARALGAVHKAGIVHRDVKPDNVLVVDPHTPAESAKLIDFGVAKVTSAEMGENSVAHTRMGSVLGSTAFASPEQLAGEPVDARTDVFALAVTLYESLSGHLPFDGTTVKEQIHARKVGAMVPLHKRGVTVTRPLGELFVSALSNDPKQRPADGRAMSKVLIAALRELEPSSGGGRGKGGKKPARRVGGLVVIAALAATLAVVVARLLHLL